MKLVICGGVHGVGKTTLMDRATPLLGKEASRFDPGELFMEHLYRLKNKTVDEIEEMLVEHLVIKVRTHPLVLSNWHYAVWTPGGYTSQVSTERWERILRETSGAELTLVRVTAAPETILARREKDRDVRKRKRDIDAVREELIQTDLFYRKFYERARQFLKPTEVTIDNTSLDDATKELVAACTTHL